MQTYGFHGLNLRVSSSAAIATCLNARFQMLPSNGDYAETIFFDFESVSDAKGHRFGKPPGRAKPFYQLEGGDASYFEAEDQLYLCMVIGSGYCAIPARAPRTSPCSSRRLTTCGLLLIFCSRYAWL